MGLAPVRIGGLGGEQAPTDWACGQVGQARPQHLVEARLIAQLVDQLVAGHDDARAPGRDLDPEDRSIPARQVHQALDRVGTVEVEQIAHQQMTWWTGNRL